ncbi:subtilisin-like protein [Myriangium duriaei CBS 260.36]|uniref:Subtilisin-like protein n=1 Tax=Myriangium duriaei CBS 260.36 TaxID=1168546 RepID=A0A9P4J771_9PEZI|nr:subtilisin-like protein [Myriangium duriaei CBS 260.36]
MGFFHTTARAALLATIALCIPTAIERDVNNSSDSSVADHSSPISNSYIITLKPETDVAQHLEHVQIIHSTNSIKTEDGEPFKGVTERYDIGDFHAYAGHFSDAVLNQIKARPDVADIEHDQSWSADSFEVDSTLKTQANAPYHLNQISHRALGNEKDGYVYDGGEAHGTFAYILDSGLKTTHKEFSQRMKRARNGFDVTGGEGYDTSGHGTHIASLIGGKTFGVAKDCMLIGVKVFWGDICTTSDFLKGYNWAVKSIRGTGTEDMSVINVSLGGGRAWSMNRAVTAAAKKGVTTVVSAGNDNTKVRWTGNAIVVGATDMKRNRAKFSNFGPKVALSAPGVNIQGAWIGYGDEKTLSVSGTSQAAALVSGVVLTLKATQKLKNNTATRDTLLKLATANVVGDANGSPTLFLYNGSGK